MVLEIAFNIWGSMYRVKVWFRLIKLVKLKHSRIIYMMSLENGQFT